ncbi:hypothetical protein [Actinoplanes lobatus]|uniref:Uncharacterized protein n=1 Tax=Actinoplanes lobatus TaxID=113568 RepID=A0A7W7HIX7_9ACTN|nr:hypothetical protein [Actinoplanes lobatus]MBB4751376.1 hypothetical protein [Actinoplanes lobatus]
MPENAEEDAAQVTYSCCSAEDVDTLYRPGQTMSVHWMVEAPNGPATDAPPVELTARLSGPYATVEELKAAEGDLRNPAGDVTFTAPPIRPTGTPGEQPVSSIPISADARPGYYYLITSENQGGGSVSGGSIIRVVA